MFATTRMDLSGIMLKEISQKKLTLYNVTKVAIVKRKKQINKTKINSNSHT